MRRIARASRLDLHRLDRGKSRLSEVPMRRRAVAAPRDALRLVRPRFDPLMPQPNSNMRRVAPSAGIPRIDPSRSPLRRG